MKKRILYLFVVLLLFFTACGVSRQKAEEAEQKQEYALAAKLYKTLYRKTSPSKREVRSYYAFHYAENYRAIHQYQRALSGYHSAYRYHYPDSVVLLRLGEMSLACNKSKEAKRWLESYQQYDSTNLELQRSLKVCALLDKEGEGLKACEVKRMHQNSSGSDYAPAYALDGKSIYFTSTRAKTKDNLSNITGESDGNIFVIKRDDKGQWSLRADTIGGNLNTLADEGVSSCASGLKEMYYSLAEEEGKYKTVHIYQSSSSGEGQWSKGNLLNVWQDSTLMAAHPSISPSGMRLFFVSDVIGGVGGKDIYYVDLEGGKMSYPISLGTEINTPKDELFPYAMSDSLFYFSSNGKVGYGGFDIYQAQLLPSHKWEVTLLPRPINGTADDYSLALQSDEHLDEDTALSGILASNRNDGRGRPHLYSVRLPKMNVYLEGYVMDREGYAIPNAIIRTVGRRGGEKLVSSKQDGSYRLKVEGDVSYVMLASAEGFLNRYAKLHTDSLKDENIYYGIDFYLASKVGSEGLKNVYYAFDSAEILAESEAGLSELKQILDDNPDISVELSAHTDRKGEEAYNQKLSERRAKSVYNWLVERGIKSERLIVKGYGEQQNFVITPRVAEKYDFLQEGQCLREDFIESLSPEQQEICDSLNRRTEFKVID